VSLIKTFLLELLASPFLCCPVHANQIVILAQHIDAPVVPKLMHNMNEQCCQPDDLSKTQKQKNKEFLRDSINHIQTLQPKKKRLIKQTGDDMDAFGYFYI